MAEVAAETAAPDDIRSALASAYVEHETPEPAPAAKPAKEAPELPLEAADDKSGTTIERDDAGKFVKKAEGDTEKPEVKTEGEPAEKPEGETENKLSPDFQKTLSAWKPADQTMFKALAPEAQQFVMRRYKEMTADYTKKLQDVSRLKTEYDPVDKIFEPHRDVMRQKGFTPASLIESWSNVEKKLASGEHGALEVIGGLINGYNIPREKVAALVGVRQQAQPQVGQDGKPVQAPPVQLPPELLQQINELRQSVTGLTAAQRAQQEAARTAAGERAMNEIDQFKSAVDDKGTLLRPHFEELEQDMLSLVQGRIANKQTVPPLQELYETAVWANPSTREKMLAAKEQAEQQKRVDQDKSKAAAARKAAVSVTGAPGSGQAAQVRNTPQRSLREEIEENLSASAA